jgi:hypothetical protein
MTSLSVGDPITVFVRTADAQRWEFRVDSSIPVDQFKQLVLSEKNLKGKKLRLIFQGHLLVDSKSLAEQEVLDQTTLHVAISDMAVSSRAAADEQPAVLRGFNQLLEAGFSAQDVQEMRVQFHASRMSSGEFLGTEHPDMLFRAEEAWIRENIWGDAPSSSTPVTVTADSGTNTVGGDVAVQVAPSQPHRRSRGSHTQQMILGVVLGFFLNLFSLVLIMEKSMPSRVKVGILTGICVNFVSGFLQPPFQ